MEQKLDLIIKELNTVKEEIGLVRSELKEEIGSVRSELKEEIGSVRSELKEEIGSVRSELKEEIGSVRSELKEEIGSVRSELGTVKVELQTEINTLKTKFEILESNQLTFLQELREQRLENQTREKIFLNEFNKINESIKFVNRRVADVELEVDELKRDLKEYKKINLG